MLVKNVGMYLTINSACYILLALVNIVRFLIQGMGYSVLTITAGVLEMIGRGFAGKVLVPRFGYVAACMASPLAWVLADIFLIVAFVMIMRKLRGEALIRRESISARRLSA